MRPGPTMVAIAAGIGFVIGSVLGLAVPVVGGQSGAPSTAPGAAGVTATTLPDRFWIVVMNSPPLSGGRERADAVADRFRSRGVPEVGVLDPASYTINADVFAVHSGIFPNEAQAEARRGVLVDQRLCSGCYVRGPIERRGA